MKCDVRFAMLRSFLSVIETGSYAETGRQLGLDATTVGRHIVSLEEALGERVNAEIRSTAPKKRQTIPPTTEAPKAPKPPPFRAVLFSLGENRELSDCGRELQAFAERTLRDFDAMATGVADIVEKARQQQRG